MLMLTRKPGEGVVLRVGDHEATVYVTKIDRGRATLAIEAPRDVRIWRDELEPDPVETLDAASEIGLR